MTEELKVVEEKECNCPVCKLLKSDCTKKFIATVLASFIGCSLAILLFAPKKPPRIHKCPPPHVKMWDKQIPPHYRDFQRPMPYHMYKSEWKRHSEFRKNCSGKDGFKRPDVRKGCPRKFEKGDNKPLPKPNTENTNK